jgi:hypothetical protein
MSSYVTKKKKNPKLEVIYASCRDRYTNKIKGDKKHLLNKEARRCTVGDCGYIDWIVANSEAEDLADIFDWNEKTYGLSRQWDRFKSDNIGVNE